MSSHCPFRPSKLLTAFAAAGLVLSMPAALPLHAQTAPPQQAELSDTPKPQADTKPQAEHKPQADNKAERPSRRPTGTGSMAAVNPAQKGVAGRAIDKVKEVAKSADRHLQPRPLPAAEGRLQIDGLAAARR